eukprot:14507-Eustigmatos_ZCMA.PRE.1
MEELVAYYYTSGHARCDELRERIKELGAGEPGKYHNDECDACAQSEGELVCCNACILSFHAEVSLSTSYGVQRVTWR